MVHKATETSPQTHPTIPQTLRLMDAICDIRMRTRLIMEQAATLPPHQTAPWLHHLTQFAIQGHPSAQQAWLALALGITLARHPQRTDPLAWCQPTQQAALQQGHLLVAQLLTEGTARQTLSPRGKLREPSITEAHSLQLRTHHQGLAHKAPDGKLRFPSPPKTTQSIYRRMHQRFGPNLQRALFHPNPNVVQRLLQQPWLQQRDALIIAARRPSTPEICHTLATQERWMVKAPIRQAIVMNPFTPLSLTLPLLPTLGRTGLQTLLQNPVVHPTTLDCARRLLTLSHTTRTSTA